MFVPVNLQSFTHCQKLQCAVYPASQYFDFKKFIVAGSKTKLGWTSSSPHFILLNIEKVRFTARSIIFLLVQVLLNGRLIGHFDRDRGVTLEFTADGLEHSHERGGGTLDIVVEAVGRSNIECDWDFKGLQNGNVTLNGAPIAENHHTLSVKLITS